MKRIVPAALIAAIVVLMLSLLILPAAATETTIFGEVTEDFRLLADDGVVYEVADTEPGNEMLVHVGKKVMATGTIEANGDERVLVVVSYILEEE